MRTIRLFVSSPGDVPDERQRVKLVADRLSGEYVRFETILWESSVYTAHESYQPQIDKRAKPAECDIVLAIFWSKLGTELPDDFPEVMPDGKRYPSGSAYEVLSSLEARRANQHRPDVFVFRNIDPYKVAVNDKAEQDEAYRQWKRLDDFFGTYFELPDKRVLRAVQKFRTLSEFEEKVELLLRDWIKSNVSQGTVWPIEEKGSPFRGLEPFDAKHADVYCGRDRKVLRAIDELLVAARRGKPFLLIPGTSGSGKSSLMRAGLAPRLVRPGTVKDVDIWRIAVMRPATDGNPLLALARSLFVTGDEKKDDPGGYGKALPELSQGDFATPEDLVLLFQDTGTAKIAVKPILAALDKVAAEEMERRRFERPLQANLLLLVDQLEDIFAESVEPDDRRRFANLLAAFANTQRIWLIATLRGDMYERMITDRPFIALKDICAQFDLSPPGADELDEIVHRSAEAAGLQYEERIEKDEAEGERRKRLDDCLLRDAAGENTLPLLQFTLDLLFEKCCGRCQSKVLTLAAYEEIGGLDGAINQTAELALARLVRPGADIHFPLEKDIQDEIARTINPLLEVLLRKLVVPIGRDSHKADASAERALTARIVPLAEARRDSPTGQLIDALLQARILLAPQSKQGSYLRIAHDRVMTSWHRARTIIDKNRDFYRIQESIEQERQRWEENNRSIAFLIPVGAQMTQAEQAVRQFSDEFSEENRTFVAISSRRALFHHRLKQAAIIAVILVAFFATGAYFYARQQRQRATENYEAARDTVGRLVTSIADKLRDRDGIRVETIDEALTQVVRLINQLEAVNKDDPELNRIHASMHFEFAKAYQNSRDLVRALEESKESFKIRSQLAERPFPKSEWLADKALSFEQMGDIRREMAKQYKEPRDPHAQQEYAESRKLFDQAYEIRLQLYDKQRDNPKWAFGLSQSLVRIGDHKAWPDKKNADAKKDYLMALEKIFEVIQHDPGLIQRDPDSKDLLHELGWCFRKVGDILLMENDLPNCLDMYAKSLITRRFLASKYPLNTLYKRDIAWSLEKIGIAKSKEKDFAGAKTALFEAFEIRQELIGQDPSQKLWLIEYAESLYQIGLYMLDTKNFVMAGGFFELAQEKIKLVAGDGREKKLTSDLIKAAILADPGSLAVNSWLCVAQCQSITTSPAAYLLFVAQSVSGSLPLNLRTPLKMKSQALSLLPKMAPQPKVQSREAAQAWDNLRADLVQSKLAALAQRE